VRQAEPLGDDPAGRIRLLPDHDVGAPLLECREEVGRPRAGDAPPEPNDQVLCLARHVDPHERPGHRLEAVVGAAREAREPERLDLGHHPRAPGEGHRVARRDGRPGNRDERVEMALTAREREDDPHSPGSLRRAAPSRVRPACHLGWRVALPRRGNHAARGAMTVHGG
jgi:hypothetical protein